jgi:hypothetical protein
MFLDFQEEFLVFISELRKDFMGSATFTPANRSDSLKLEQWLALGTAATCRAMRT